MPPLPRAAALERKRKNKDGPPGLAVVAVVLLLIAMPLVLVCSAGAYGIAYAGLAEATRHTEAEILKMNRARSIASDLAGLLDELEGYLLSLHADTNGFPESLPEALPDDPYGRPVRYERRDLDHALLMSDGRDQKSDTTDDVTRDVRAR